MHKTIFYVNITAKYILNVCMILSILLLSEKDKTMKFEIMVLLLSQIYWSKNNLQISSFVLAAYFKQDFVYCFRSYQKQNLWG